MKKVAGTGVVLSIFLVLVSSVFAATTPVPGSGSTGPFPAAGSGIPVPGSGATNPVSGGGFTLENPLAGGANNLCSLIKSVLGVVLQIGFPFAVLFIVYAGFLFVWARGNPVALQHARKNLLYTVIGLGIFFGAWLLAQVIANTLQVLSGNTIDICN